jgi:hypothetical protein
VTFVAVAALLVLTRSIEASAAGDRPLVLKPPAEAPPSVETHLLVMERRLALEQRRFTVWRWSWMLAYGGLVLGNLALVPVVPRADRIDYYTGAVTSTIGTLTLALQPVQPSARVTCPEEAAQRAACVERRYGEVRAYQRGSRGWPAHAINVAFNLGVSAFLVFGFGRWRSAGENLLIGTAIGELQIQTQPHDALGAF